MKKLILVVALLVAACSKDDKPPPPEPAEGRAETRNIRNVDVMGYDGKAIADKVDGALNANDAAIKKAQKDSEERKDPDAKPD